MKTQLRYISISHKNASVSCRERYCLSEAEKVALAKRLTGRFNDLGGLLFLFTCNRAELYFESRTTRTADVLKEFLSFKFGDASEGSEHSHFRSSEETDQTARHLLRVSAGLESAVLGDAEILHQIKKAFQLSMRLGCQGSVLERLLQAVFRAHKRISNETAYRDGTTSTAYKSLKMISTIFGAAEGAGKEILIVGAGDIARQLLAYNTKFGYKNIHITNRSPEKASELAGQHGIQTWPWERLEANELEEFDVIISAVSNRQGLIRKGIATDRETLLIDLAVPGNIRPALGNRPGVHWFDLDAISQQLEQTRATRAKAIREVEVIINAEQCDFMVWLEAAPKRALLARRKAEILSALKDRVHTEGTSLTREELAVLANRILRKLLKDPVALQQGKGMETWISQYAALPLAS